MEPQEFTLETFEAAIKQDQPVVVDFWAAWSVACLMYKEKLVDAYVTLLQHAVCGSVDIDLQKELAERFSIITIPTTLIFFKGEIVKQFIGIQEPNVLIDTINAILGIKEETPKVS